MATVAAVVALAAVVVTTAGIGSAAVLAAAATIATIANVVAVTAALGAQLLTKPPPARGSITQVLVASDPPQPYLMGESYFGGVLRHDTGYGATLKKVPNPYRGMVIAYSGSGPLEELVEVQTDFAAVSAYFTGFLDTDRQLGETPESTALVPPLSAPMTGWDSTSKLSGQAAILFNLKFDKEGKRFASGLPVLGAIWKGVKVYDPRLDSTYPGGSGAHRIDDETTWEYSDNPGLHALTYAYGRVQNGIQVFGIGVPAAALRISEFVTLANVCEANDWRLSGIIYEPGDRWNNLKDILAAGAAEPIFANGTLGVRIRTPTVALDTITEADLADESASVTSMQSYRDRLNAVIPKYRSPVHNWELVAADAVRVSEYETEDGEEKIEEVPYNLVRDVDQAAQLAAYRLVDGRELGPINLVCMPRLRSYRPGECLTLDLPSLGLTTDAIILTRRIDPATMKVTLTLIGETPAKHDYALGLTGTPPATPALGQTAEERDELAAAATAAASGAHRLISLDPLYPLTSDDVSISVAAFDGVTDDGRTIAFPADSVTGLTASTAYNVFWDGAAYSAAVAPTTTDMADSDLIFIGFQATDDGAGTYPGGTTPPGGYGGTGGGYEP